MKKSYLYLLLTACFLIFILISRSYTAQWTKETHFSTPLEALMNVNDPSLKVLEIIDERIYEEDNYGYIFFYTQLNEPKDYYVVSEFKKETNGWKFVSMFGGGPVEKHEKSYYFYSGGYEEGKQFGLANPEVSYVRRGNREAEIVPLQNNLKIWFIYKPSLEDLEYDLEFYDDKGELIER